LLALAVRAGEADEGAVALRREQRALGRFTHPGAVELRDAGTTELGDPYVVLEPLDGRALDGHLAARSKLVPGDACAVVLQLADVLAAAHAAGVVHRHVVTENVVVVRDGWGVERVKLTGWGRATVGEPASVKVDEDLAALGVCAFEALTGRRPKPGEDAVAAGVSPSLAPVVSRLIARGFGSARDFTRALEEVAPKARQRTQLLGSSPQLREARPDKAAVPASDQRRATRAAYRTPVRVEVPGLGALEGRSEDISGGGLMVVAKGGVKGGTEVTVRFALPIDGRVVAEPATIKWSRAARFEDPTGLCALGVQLTAPGPETLRQVDRYVALMRD
jgi:serine/threonine-protein kinase